MANTSASASPSASVSASPSPSAPEADVATSTIVTLAEMRAFLNLPTAQTGQDAVIITLLDGYNSMINDYLGVTMVTSTYTETYDGNDTDCLFLKHYPIISVTSLSIDEDDLASTDYKVYNDEGYIKIDSTTFSLFTKDIRNVYIVYTAGYGTARGYVNNTLKLALKTWVARVFKAEIVDFSQRFDESSLAHIKSPSMPWDVKTMLDNYRCRKWGRD